MAETFNYTREWTDEKAFPLLGFSRDWNNPEDYPTVETDEQKVREDMQSLHDEVKNYLNETLIPAVIAEEATVEDWEHAESLRAEAETARIEAEQARAEAETLRAEAERARAEAEPMRLEAEAARIEAERARAAAESSRINAEQERVAAEQERADDATGYVALSKQYAEEAAASAKKAANIAGGDFVTHPELEDALSDLSIIPIQDTEPEDAELWIDTSEESGGVNTLAKVAELEASMPLQVNLTATIDWEQDDSYQLVSSNTYDEIVEALQSGKNVLGLLVENTVDEYEVSGVRTNIQTMGARFEAPSEPVDDEPGIGYVYFGLWYLASDGSTGFSENG